MKTVTVSKTVVIGDGDSLRRLVVDFDDAGLPRHVEIQNGAEQAVASMPACEIERIAKALEGLRLEAPYKTPGRNDSVCADHGYYSTDGGVYVCPKCEAATAVAA